MMKWSGIFFLGIVALMLVLGIAAGMVALSPSQIEKPSLNRPRPTAVKLPDPPKAEEPPPPPPDSQPSNSLLAELAPDSFSSAVEDLGAGVGFGSGGGGPAIGGGGGFGSDAGQLVKNQTSVDRPARVVVKAAPDYPQEGRSRGVSGFVVLRIFIGPSGMIEDVKVQDSEPHGFFDQAALKAVKAWRFDPAISKGQSVASWTTQKIKFELN